jgi:MoxR-like ATPase
MSGFNEITRSVMENVEKVIIGKHSQLKIVFAAILARGHVLLEDVPGVAKTMLARSFSITFGCDFKRIQCTPDLLPTDITGVSIFNQKKVEFEFIQGPVFTNILLADEINRATPRAQAALLESMEEKQITVDGETYQLSPPFVVLATQNPIEQEGTFPLPEAQLDRFLIRISLGYPDFDQESEMLERLRGGHPIKKLKSVINAETVVKMQEYAEKVYVHKDIRNYILKIVHATRGNFKLGLGASPRASIALYRCSQAMAALDGRNYIIPDDVKKLCVSVLSHRIILKPEYRLRKESTKSVVEEILSNIEVPTNIKSFMPSKRSRID